MARNTNDEFRNSLRDMTDEFRKGVREAAYSARDRARAHEGAGDPRLRMVAERLDRELASQKASFGKRFARFGAPEGATAPNDSNDD